jgi:acetyl esterase
MKIPFKIRILLWFINKSKAPKIYEVGAPQARKNGEKELRSVENYIDFPVIPLFKVTDRNIPVRNAEIPIRIYQATDAENLPVILFFHGGGFVLSNINSHDRVCRRIARDNNAVVISVDYRLAPEYKFPIPVQDCYDATVWAAQNAEIHKGDVSRLMVMGDSAGGNLATATCMMARDLGGPAIQYQVLIYPCTDGTMSCESVNTYRDGYLLTKKMMDWFLEQYKSKPEDVYSPYLSPLLAKDVSNLPPAFVFTAEYDPLKDEGRQYAERMKAAGNRVIYKDYGGLIHGFINMPKMSKHILTAYQDIQDVLAAEFRN